MTTPKQVVRPALNVHAQGGQIVFVDPASGVPKQVIGKQDDGTVGIVDVNGEPTPAPSTPVVGAIGAGLAVTWDGLLAGDTTGPQLLVGGDFEAGTDAWTPGQATVAQSSVQVHGGAFSALVTPFGVENGSPAAGLSSEQVQVTGGQTYELDCWVWLTTAVTLGFDLAVDWYSVDIATGLQTLISTSSAPASAAAGAWVHLVRSVTAPSTAVFAVVRPTLLDPAATDVWYLDDIAFAQVVSSVPANFDHVAVHVSQLDGFNPDGASLQGTLNHSGTFPVTDLIPGTEYFVRLVAVNTSGIAGGVSAQASGVPTATVIGAGQITETEIADDAISTPKLQANAVTTAKIAANQIVAGLIAAGAITADKLAATLVLASQIIVGDPAGGRVTIDPQGGFRAYNPDGAETVTIGSDGSASFRGSQVVANDLVATALTMNTGPTGALMMYGSDPSLAAPLNANPDMATGITGWTADGVPPATLTYATPVYNGHNTLRLAATGQDAATWVFQASSALVPVVAGHNYTASLIAQVVGTATVSAIIDWYDSAGTRIGSNQSQYIDTPGDWQPVSITVTAPTGATQAHVKVFGRSLAQTDTTNVAYLALSGLSLPTTLATVPGTDPYGNTYPAGLRTDAVETNTLSVNGDAFVQDLTAGSVALSGSDASLLLPGSTSAILNSNPTFDTGTTPWAPNADTGIAWAGGSADNYASITWSTPFAVNPATPSIVSEAIPVTAGASYQVDARVWCTSTDMGAYVALTWQDASGAAIQPRAQSQSTFKAGQWVTLTATGKPPAGAVTCRIRVSWATRPTSVPNATSQSLRVAEASVVSLSTLLSMAGNAGTDPVTGLAYPAGISSPFPVVAPNLPGNFKMGHVATTTGASGDITVSHNAGFTPDAVVCFPNAATSGYIFAVHDITATTFTVRVQGGANSTKFPDGGGAFINVGSGVAVDFNFLAFAA